VNDISDRESGEKKQLVRSVYHAGRLVENQLDSALSRHGLSIAKMGVLRALKEADQPLALWQVAESLACVRSNVTQLIDRLEEDGLVRRVPDGTDRRSIRAAITDEGRRRCAAGEAEEARVESDLLDGLSPEERAGLQQLLNRFSGRFG
jgi:DNA-binding MarR family transcriptional regulator